jgi:tRNA dimethylallyltransferase
VHEKITTNTAQLAKRQRTFNASQFPPHIKEPVEKLHNSISKIFTRKAILEEF